MNTQVSTAATLPTNELARVTQVFTGELACVTQVFGDARPPVPQLLGKVTVGAYRRHEALRDLIYAPGDTYHPWYVEAATPLMAIGLPALRELTAVLSRTGSRLKVYQAAEALDVPGDGVATYPDNPLRHPNSHVSTVSRESGRM